MEKWYVVGEPRGDGTWIVEGNPDPHLGLQVADCNMIDGEVAFDGKVGPSPEQRAEQIVREHNAHEALIGALEEALALLATERSFAKNRGDEAMFLTAAIERGERALALAHPQGDQDG